MMNRTNLARSLLGYFHDDEIFSRERLSSLINENWTLLGDYYIHKYGNIFSIQFDREEDLEFVVSQSPVNFNGALFVMAHWRPNTCLETFKIEYADVWIQLHGIPLEYFVREHIEGLVDSAGERIVIEWNSPEAEAKEFIRAKIRIPLDMPVIPG